MIKQKRINISSNAKWEDIVGYSRAVKVGNHIYVSRTTATDNNGKIVGIDDAAKQTKQCITNIEEALKKLGATLNDIVRTRIYVVNIDDWEKIGIAFGKYFKTIKPTATMVEVNRLITPEILVEIEADAFLL